MIKRIRKAWAAKRKASGKAATTFNAQLLDRNREEIHAVLHRIGMTR
ncbi:hypothetical protein [Arthrobacter sp. 92]|nr:hypothetical protein AHiyo6_06380 [Arthrobacter sp. Hiyo6]